MGKLSSGNAAVDDLVNFSYSGNLICDLWFNTIKNDCGKSDLLAIYLLSDIVYWYRPEVIRDEATGEVIGLKKKFKSDLLQKSYEQYASITGQPKSGVKSSMSLLEKLGLIRREFRTIKLDSGIKLPNVMFIELNTKRLREITDYLALQKSDEIFCDENNGGIYQKNGGGGETCGQIVHKLKEDEIEQGTGGVMKSAEISGFSEFLSNADDTTDSGKVYQKNGVYQKNDIYPSNNLQISRKNTDSCLLKKADTNTENTTETTNREYNHINRSADDADRCIDQSDGTEWIYDKLYTPEERREQILTNTDYSWHMINEEGEARKEYEDLVAIVCDVVCGKYKNSIKIGGALLPINTVKERLWNLDSSHIEYVRDCLHNLENRKGIKSMKNYLLTCLYNSALTKDQHEKLNNYKSIGLWSNKKEERENDTNGKLYEQLFEMCGA